MKGIADESVGSGFQVASLESARQLTLEVILEAAAQMKPGATEAQAKALIQEIQTRRGAPKSWHPPQIRFGENTCLAFGVSAVNKEPLKKDDIFFFDIGPIYQEHEGDVGRTFCVGENPEMKKCASDVEKIWHEVREHWRQTGATGEALYGFARQCASSHGWVLLLESANGHRIADFPHAAKNRGSIESFPSTPAPNRWILEIQIRHPELSFGAFYEDLLS